MKTLKVLFWILGMMFLLQYCQDPINIFEWSHNPEKIENYNSILRDAQAAYNQGDLENSVKYYTRVIDLLGNPDWKPWDEGGIEALLPKSDPSENRILAEAYAGRATAVVRDILGLERFLNIFRVFINENAASSEAQHIFPKIFEKPTEVESFQVAEDIYMKLAPIVVADDDTGDLQPVFDIDVEAKAAGSAIRTSVGQDLLLAAHYSEKSGRNADALNYHLNFSIATVLSMLFNICDANANSKFVVNGAIDPGDVMWVGINTDGDFDIQFQATVEIDGVEYSIMDEFERLSTSYQQASVDSITSVDQAQHDLAVIEAAVEIIEGVNKFQDSLIHISEFAIKSYENVVCRIAGRDSVTLSNDTTNPVEVNGITYNPGAVIFEEDPDYFKNYKGTDPNYASMKEMNTTLFRDIFNTDETYNRGLEALDKEYTLLFAVLNTLDDLENMKGLMISFKFVVKTAISFLEQYGSIDPNAFFEDPAAFVDAILPIDPNDPDAVAQAMEDAQAALDILTNPDGDLFSEQANTGNVSPEVYDTAQCALCQAFPTLEGCAEILNSGICQ